MNAIQIDENEESLRISFIQPKANIFVRGILFIMTLISFAIPILMMYYLGVMVSTIMSVFFFIVPAYLFLRYFLWNSYGKEIIEISNGKIRQIISYGLFEDKSMIGNKNVSLKIHFENDDTKLIEEAKTNEILDSNLSKYVHPGVFRFILNRDVAIEINTIIPPKEVENLEEKILKFLEK